MYTGSVSREAIMTLNYSNSIFLASQDIPHRADIKQCILITLNSNILIQFYP